MRYILKYRSFYLLLIDIFTILASYLLSYSLFVTNLSVIGNVSFNQILLYLPILLIIYLVVSYFFGVNRTLWKYASIEEAIRVGFAIAFSNVLFLFTINIIVPVFPKILVFISALIQVILLLGLRLFYRYYRRLSLTSNRNNNAVIIGAGDAGVILSKELMLNDKYNTKMIGFIDDNDLKQNKTISGYKVLGKTSDLAELKGKYHIDVAFIAIKNITKDRKRHIIEVCQKNNIPTKIISIEEDSYNNKPKLRDISIEDLLGRGEIKLDTKVISEQLSNQVIMVTGAGGSIGSELVRQIIKFKPKQLVLVDIYENNMYSLQQEIIIEKRNGNYDTNIDVVCLIASVRDEKRIDTIIKKYKPVIVYHAAAHKHVPLVEDSPLEAIKNNVFGTYNVINCCINNNIPRFVLISTDKAVNPTNVMGATKRLCEMMIQALKDNGTTSLCAVRFGNVLGSNGSVVPLFKKQIENGGPVTVTHPDIIRYFMTIPEASQLVLESGCLAKSGEIFVLDMGSPVKIVTLAENMIKLCGLTPNVDIKIEFTGLRPGEKMFEELILNKETSTKTQNDLIFISKPMHIEEQYVKDVLAKLEKMIKNNDNNIKEELLSIIINDNN